MSIAKCLANAVKEKDLTKEEAADLKRRYDELVRAHKGSGAADADLRAKQALAEELAAEGGERKRRLHLQSRALKRVQIAVGSYRTAGKRADKAEGAIALVEHYGTARYASVVGRKKAIIAGEHARMADLLMTFERTALTGTTPDRAKLDNVVKELFGEASGDASAKMLAQAFAESAERLRHRFNRAGGNIAKLEKWGLPQIHEPAALMKAGKETWKAFVTPMLDVAKMRHPSGRPLMRHELSDALDAVYDAIVTEGWSKRQPASVPFGKGALASQRAEHRFLIFRSAEDWTAYAQVYGQPNAFASMMNHVSSMARDIAALEILGPNPSATIEFLKQTAMQEGKLRAAAGIPRAASRGARKAKLLEDMWNGYRGTADAPVTKGLATFGTASRNWITASVLGSAVISAVPTDPMFQAIARHMAGIPVANTLFATAKAFRQGTKAQAVRNHLILDSAMHVFGEQARYVGMLDGPHWSNVLPDRVLAISGLTPWTQSGRHAFGLEFAGALADQAHLPFDRAPLKKAFERWGISPEEWDRIRSAKQIDDMLSPAAIEHVDPKLAERVAEMILMETEYAVPSTTLRGQGMWRGENRPGTIVGEIRRSAAMFKSFAVTFALLYGGRLAREWSASRARGAAYAGAILATTTLGGALAMWTKDVINGRDPRPLNSKTMAAAMLQGGGLGIYGDFLFSDVNRFGGGFDQMLLGPVVERAGTVRDLTIGNAIQLAAGEDTDFLQELIRFARVNVPGSNVWMWRLAYDRVLLDGLQHATDPQANKAFKRKQQYYRREFGSEFWWAPGETSPARAPDFGTVLQP
ncbi:MAG: hypothetical protein AB7S41_11385 [Parvibaculaceae bacterium]